MTKPALSQIAADRTAVSIGPDSHERASGISRAIARRSSVASFRYGSVASSDRWPNRSPIALRLYTRGLQSLADLAIERRERAIRGPYADEDFAGVGLGSASTQIVQQRLANLGHQWQLRVGPGLGMADV